MNSETSSTPDSPAVCQSCSRPYSVNAETEGDYTADMLGFASLCPSCWRQFRSRVDSARLDSGIEKRYRPFLVERRGQSWGMLAGPAPYGAVVARVRMFAERGDTVLAVIGKRGTGKTQIGSVAVWECCFTRGPARITTLYGLVADLKGRYGKDGASESEWLAEWSAPDLLVIDEIAERFDTNHERTVFTAIVDSRYRKCKPTILIGNLTAEQLCACVGSSITDRCNEGLGGIVVCDKWPSFRKATT